MVSATTREAFAIEAARAAEEFAGRLWETAVERGEVADADQWVRVNGSALLRRLLGNALSARSERLGTSGNCSCGGSFRFRQRKPFHVHTVVPGRDVPVRFLYAQCERCGSGLVPSSVELKADNEGFTRGLQELALLAGVIEPYGNASSELLERFAGVSVSREKIHALVQQDGKIAHEFLRELPPEPAKPFPEATQDQPCYVGIDGGMIFVDKRWQEVKLACIFQAKDRSVISDKRAELIARQVVAVRGNPAALGEMLWPRASAAGVGEQRVVVLGDGAPWIWNLAAEHFPNRVEILDWYHADEHVSETARILYGEGTDKAAEWRDAQLGRLMEDGIGDVIEALRFLESHQRSSTKRETVEELRGYLTTNQERMRYKTFKAAGYHIGSGSVESAVSHVVQQRMKRVGMRWKAEGADRMLALRSVYRSTGAWDRFWERRMAA